MAATTTATQAGLAGLDRRAVAHLCDWVVLAPVAFVAYGPVLRSVLDAASDRVFETGRLSTADTITLVRSHLAGILVASAIAWAVSVVYDLLLTRWRGQTVGKMLLRIRVVDEDTRHGVSWRQAAIRAGVPGMLSAVGSLTPVGSVAVGVDYLWPLWDPLRRTLHDRAAGTVVIETKRAAPIEPPVDALALTR